MKKWSTFLLLLTALSIGNNSNAQSFQKTDLGIKATINSTAIEIQYYNPSTVRVLKSPDGRPFTKESLSVIKTPQKTTFQVKQQGDWVNLKTTALNIALNLKTGAIIYSTVHDEYLLKEKQEGVQFTPFNDAGNNTFTVQQSFELDNDEPIYGLGQQQQGKMSQRNVTLNMVQGNLDDYIPFFQSVKGYGVFWDNYSPTVFTDNPQGTSFKSDVGDGVDYYFMYGGNADGVIARMRELTGQAPLFPLWTFGYWQSKERYKSQDELVEVVKQYRKMGVPLDGIIQDWQYWGSNYLWNAMDFLNAEFPKPEKMVSDVHQMNAHMIISIWNSFGPQTKQYKELDKIGALMNFSTWPQSGSDLWPPRRDYPSGVRVYDPYNPAARDIYWKYLEHMYKLRLDGWWMDSSEPDHLDAKPSDFDNKTYLGSFRKVRNAFPLMTVGGVSTHQRAIDSGKRVFILTRSAFAGQQRYGANTWSGDVTSSWNALMNQISAGLNFSLTGIPYWNADIGGFFLSRFKRKLEDPEYRELYVRWLQFGAFTPMMRSHGADAPREIYQFGQKGNTYYDAIEKYINLRYHLLPYIYSTSWDVTANQSSMMRALVMDFPKDKNALDLNDEFMFGRSLLVSPVTNAMYVKPVPGEKETIQAEDFSEIKSKTTYLPDGTDWYDFWTAEKFSGGQKVSRQTPLDIIPVYVKAGTVMPVGPSVQYAEEKKWDSLEIRVYPGANGKFVLYEDENDNYNYERGVYATVTFTWDDTKKMLTISDRNGSFPGMIGERKFNVVMVTGHTNKVIAYTGKKIVVKF
ncbi:xylosidase [Niastella koreensis]|uniref:Glycoside hydrolase family 31 n=2 Tax=Niastella koreensis TaxID=354356 RepID=G8TM07_NIAKG|nr:TIM-barrel domain-containing protein [Niastella koreensis]AEV98767.1 glycoside hydrolase family 31 [Niastella koreensis GR20-10]OQP43705.1 xylosidase [Niastella koreensis]